MKIMKDIHRSEQVVGTQGSTGDAGAMTGGEFETVEFLMGIHPAETTCWYSPVCITSVKAFFLSILTKDNLINIYTMIVDYA
jgi:hypothetical protein